MTQEEKQLLVQDLCTRLPYGVIVQDDIGRIYKLNLGNAYLADLCYSNGDYIEIPIKPYLRPMSSMTEEERNEMSSTISPQGSAIYYNEYIGIPLTHLAQQIPYTYIARVVGWLNAHHFDYRGLIPKGLAISTEVFNPYND